MRLWQPFRKVWTGLILNDFAYVWVAIMYCVRVFVDSVCIGYCGFFDFDFVIVRESQSVCFANKDWAFVIAAELQRRLRSVIPSCDVKILSVKNVV